MTNSKPLVAYIVSITARAERDLISIYDRIDAGHSDAAMKWFRGLKRELLSLEMYPNRCPATPEDKNLRHLLYRRKPHVYRVIYRVSEQRNRVDILHIRHGARRKFAQQT